jgi:hypothetical protein
MGIAQPLQQVFSAPQVESDGVVKAWPSLVIGAAQEKVEGSGVVHRQFIEWKDGFFMMGYYIIGANLSQVAEGVSLYYT